jgi:starch phosphorylase
VRTDDLAPDDIVVELLLAPALRELAAHRESGAYSFKSSGKRGEGGEHLFDLDLSPDLCGKLEYRIRAYPFHKGLSHRFELGLMKWV